MPTRGATLTYHPPAVAVQHDCLAGGSQRHHDRRHRLRHVEVEWVCRLGRSAIYPLMNEGCSPSRSASGREPSAGPNMTDHAQDPVVLAGPAPADDWPDQRVSRHGPRLAASPRPPRDSPARLLFGFRGCLSGRATKFRHLHRLVEEESPSPWRPHPMRTANARFTRQYGA